MTSMLLMLLILLFFLIRAILEDKQNQEEVETEFKLNKFLLENEIDRETFLPYKLKEAKEKREKEEKEKEVKKPEEPVFIRKAIKSYRFQKKLYHIDLKRLKGNKHNERT